MSVKTFAVTNDGLFLLVTNTGTGRVESFNLADIKGVTYEFQSPAIGAPGTYPYVDMAIVVVEFSGKDPALRIELASITNQPGWTPDAAGCIQAEADIRSWLNAVAGSGATSGLATEATLNSLLNNLIASQDVEILLVRDTGAADVVVQQIREYDQGTGVWTTRYEDVSGGAYAVVGPLEYLDPSAILNLLLTETTNQGIDIGAIKTAVETTATPITGVVSSLIIATGAPSSVAAGKRTVSFLNSGIVNVTVNGGTLKPGLTITYPELSNRDTYAAIPYDPSTGEITITTVG